MATDPQPTDRCSESSLVTSRSLCSTLVDTTWSAAPVPRLWGPLHKKDADPLGKAQKRATNMIREMEPLPHDNRLRNLWLSSLKNRRLWGDLINL